MQISSYSLNSNMLYKLQNSIDIFLKFIVDILKYRFILKNFQRIVKEFKFL